MRRVFNFYNQAIYYTHENTKNTKPSSRDYNLANDIKFNQKLHTGNAIPKNTLQFHISSTQENTMETLNS